LSRTDSNPGNQHAGCNRHQPGWNALRVFVTAKPAHHDDRETDDPDDRRHVHLSAGRIEMKVTETPASVPSSAARGVILRM